MYHDLSEAKRGCLCVFVAKRESNHLPLSNLCFIGEGRIYCTLILTSSILLTWEWWWFCRGTVQKEVTLNLKLAPDKFNICIELLCLCTGKARLFQIWAAYQKKTAFDLDLLVKCLCIGRGWTLRGFKGFPVELLQAFELFVSLCCSVHEVSCRRRVIGRVIALELSSNTASPLLCQRARAKEGGRGKLHRKLRHFEWRKEIKRWIENFEIDIHVQVCVFLSELTVPLLSENAIFPSTSVEPPTCTIVMWTLS